MVREIGEVDAGSASGVVQTSLVAPIDERHDWPCSRLIVHAVGRHYPKDGVRRLRRQWSDPHSLDVAVDTTDPTLGSVHVHRGQDRRLGRASRTRTHRQQDATLDSGGENRRRLVGRIPRDGKTDRKVDRECGLRAQRAEVVERGFVVGPASGRRAARERCARRLPVGRRQRCRGRRRSDGRRSRGLRSRARRNGRRR